MQFAMLPLQGLGQGAQPIISYNYGASNVERVKDAFKLLLKVSLSYAVILWGVVMLFPQIFVGLFTSDEALLEFGQPALRIYMACMFLFGIPFDPALAGITARIFIFDNILLFFFITIFHSLSSFIL